MSESKLSLFDKIGGAPQVDALIQKFYERVLSDPDLAKFFEHSDIAKLARMQREFFSVGLDGPMEYTSRRLFAAHHGRGIGRKHFSQFCNHLVDTLLEHGLPAEDADKILVRLSMYAGHVTGEGGVDG